MSLLDDLKSSLLNDLKAERNNENRYVCLVCSWLDNQEPEVVAEVEDWIQDESMSWKSLWRILQKNGLKPSYTAFRNHAHECVLKDRDRSCR